MNPEQPIATPPQPGVPAPAQPTPTMPQPGAPQKKSLLWLWITLGGVFVLLCVGALIFFITAYPGIHARALATDFMDAVRDGKTDRVKELSGDDGGDYIKNMTTQLKGASYKVTDTTDKGSTGYLVNFDVTGSSSIHDAAIIVKSDKITTFNVNTHSGAQSSQQAVASDNSTSSKTTPASKCLVLSDLTNNGITYIDQAALDTTSGSIYLDEFFFQADSTDYLNDSAATSAVDKVAALYKGTSGKDYNLQVTGATHESSSSSAGAVLANQRAQKVKDALVAKGVDASRIVIGDPTNSVNQFDSGGDSDRRIDITIARSASCMGPQTTSASDL